ncbi:VOC family protein [Nocardia sp. IFM 10818]
MDWKIELVAIPVTDVDRAKDFYTKIGFNADHDHSPSADVRFVQLTPPGSGCSICIGTGITQAAPGSVEGMQMVVASAEQAYQQLVAAGVDATPVKDEGWGLFTYFSDPDGNKWAVQELPEHF